MSILINLKQVAPVDNAKRYACDYEGRPLLLSSKAPVLDVCVQFYMVDIGGEVTFTYLDTGEQYIVDDITDYVDSVSALGRRQHGRRV